MDAEPAGYWPKVGEVCRILHHLDGKKYRLMAKVADWPVPKYSLKCLTDRTTVEVFRHELEPANSRPERLQSAKPVQAQYSKCFHLFYDEIFTIAVCLLFV